MKKVVPLLDRLDVKPSVQVDPDYRARLSLGRLQM